MNLSKRYDQEDIFKNMYWAQKTTSLTKLSLALSEGDFFLSRTDRQTRCALVLCAAHNKYKKYNSRTLGSVAHIYKTALDT